MDNFSNQNKNDVLKQLGVKVLNSNNECVEEYTNVRISDIEFYIINENKEKLKSIFEFLEQQNKNYAIQLAENFGKNIAIIINNGWECENLQSREEYLITGEFLPSAFFNIIEMQKKIEEEYSDNPEKANLALWEIRRKYTSQVMHIASCIKVVQNAMKFLEKDQNEINNVLEKFIDSFTETLDLKKIGDLIQLKENIIVETILKEFMDNQNWAEKMAKVDYKNINKDILDFHINNNEFYSEVSKKIYKRINNKQIIDNDKILTKNFITYVCNKANELYNQILKDGIKPIIQILSEEKKRVENIEIYNANEYIKKMIASQLNFDKLLFNNKYNLLKWNSNPDIERESHIIKTIIEDEKHLNFDKNLIETLFGNPLKIESEYDYEQWKNFLYYDSHGIKKFDTIFFEEEFKFNYDKEKNSIKKFFQSFKYKRLKNSKELEDVYVKKARQIIKEKLFDNPKNTSEVLPFVENIMINYINQYECIKEVEDTTRMILKSLSKSDIEKLNVANECKILRSEFKNNVQQVKLEVEYRQCDINIEFDDIKVQARSFKEISNEIENLQNSYISSYENAKNSEDYIKKISKIYTDFLFLKPYEDGNKRTAICLFNKMILANKLIPPCISLINKESLIEAYKKAYKNNDYTMIEDLILARYKKLKNNL